jgi:hypothetical protein
MIKSSQIRTILFFILIILSSCKPNYEKIFLENNEKFDKNRSILNLTISTIEKTYLKNWDRKIGLTLRVDSLDEVTKKNLTELGIGSIEITGNPYDNCDKNYWITLNVVKDWNISTLRVVQIVYAPCDSKGEKKDREKRANYNSQQDFWGQGENWFIYSDSDLF